MGTPARVESHSQREERAAAICGSNSAVWILLWIPGHVNKRSGLMQAAGGVNLSGNAQRFLLTRSHVKNSSPLGSVLSPLDLSGS